MFNTLKYALACGIGKKDIGLSPWNHGIAPGSVYSWVFPDMALAYGQLGSTIPVVENADTTVMASWKALLEDKLFYSSS